ncbi:biopolymer transporter ExbD [Roseiconus nitratireducens]|uniref:Biopolymer transporter ExbD n=1 Tax=Roseiconus nitratireducens TaxID=2605748 RepID=A0A5M6D7S0_9BACT|nr:biopolymer transporter ExbD [Roseiconus nitratireducens]KAA5543608.1 biopolymer transporter ExbD [Roseiconus nitratireducens]
MANRNRSADDVTINLTPMIDVVFLLVIFFMVGTKFSESESRIKVSVPSVGRMNAISRVPDERVIEVTADGKILLDGQTIDVDQLAESLRQQHANYPDLKVAVRGDGSSSFQRVAEVLHVVRQSGIEQLGIAAKVDPSGGGMRR